MSLEGIKPEYDQHQDTYTWYIKHPKPIKVTYAKNATSLTYSQDLIKTVSQIKTNPTNIYYSIGFANKTLYTPFNIYVKNDKTIVINWFSRRRPKRIPQSLQIKPDNTIMTIWPRTIFPRHINVNGKNNLRTIHDKQGNLLHLVNKTPSGFAYELVTISPNTYAIQPYYIRNVDQWISIIGAPKKIIHI